jgi:hypothetical protein
MQTNLSEEGAPIYKAQTKISWTRRDSVARWPIPEPLPLASSMVRYTTLSCVLLSGICTEVYNEWLCAICRNFVARYSRTPGTKQRRSVAGEELRHRSSNINPSSLTPPSRTAVLLALRRMLQMAVDANTMSICGRQPRYVQAPCSVIRLCPSTILSPSRGCG